MKSKHAAVLNVLDEMQQSVAYAARKWALADAEAIIVHQEQALAEKDQEIAKWKAAHDEMVLRNRLLRDRPDLPMDRVRAHDEVVRELAKTSCELQQIREHEFQRGYREGQASIMAKAVRFAKQCVQPIRGKAAILAAEEAQAFLKEHP